MMFELIIRHTLNYRQILRYIAQHIYIYISILEVSARHGFKHVNKLFTGLYFRTEPGNKIVISRLSLTNSSRLISGHLKHSPYFQTVAGLEIRVGPGIKASDLEISVRMLEKICFDY